MIRTCMGAVALIVAAALTPAAAQSRMDRDRGGEAEKALPPEFRGKVLYFGNHSGEVVITRPGSGRKRTVENCPRPDQRCPERIGGSLEIELEFDGPVVRGQFRGTGGLRDSGLIGRREGAHCRLFDLSDGSVWDGRCDREGFVGAVKSVPNAAVQISLNFEAVGTKVRDYEEWERRRREAMMRKRRYDFLQATLAGTGPVEGKFEAAVELDSYGWPVERYARGTLNNIRRSKEKRGVYDITGDFSLEGGGGGWARARVENEAIVCIELWSAPGACRPVFRAAPPEVPSDQPPETSLLPPQAIRPEQKAS